MSAQKLKPSGVLGGIAGLIGFSVLAGVLVTAMVTPALAVTSMTAKSSIDIFENLPDSIKISEPSQQNQVFAMRAGQPVQIATLYKQNRQVVAWDEVSPSLKQAAVDGEDRRFYKHGGVDVQSLVRAAANKGGAGGASTLDMQLVKNILVQEAFTTLKGDAQKKAIEEANGHNLDRKLKEMKLAIGLDKSYTKKQILLGYLNIVGMGTTTYGVESAALQYFSVHAKDVTLPQAASLMAIVQSPAVQSLGDPSMYPKNKIRRDQILDAMLSVGHITQKEHDDAVAAPIESYVKLSPPKNGCRTAEPASARAACDYAVNSIVADPVGSAESAKQNNKDPKQAADFDARIETAKENLVPEVTALGATPAERRTNWEKGGYKISTTIDLDLEDTAQAALDQQAPATEARFQLGATANTVEVGTGHILVMAQNKLFDDAAAAGTTVTTAYNFSVDNAYGGTNGYNTGSTYKMFDLANWLQTGHGLNDLVNGRGPQTYSLSKFTAPCDSGSLQGPPYKLQNDSNAGGGYMTVKQALVGSVNNAFMGMALKQDLCAIRDTAKSMGAHRADYNAVRKGFTGELAVGPSNVLGSNEQAPLTMAGAAATIGAGGLHCTPIIISKVVDPSGKDQPGQPVTCNQALTADVAAGVANAMQASMTGGTSRPANPYDRVPIAGKTGTAPDLEQDWVISSTTKIGSSVWTGNWDSARLSLKRFVNPNTRRDYYNSSRFNIMKAVVAAANKVDALRGGDFADASNGILSGSSASVPKVAGQTSTQAQRVLTSLKFQYADGGPEASALPVGRVTRTDPAEGSKVPSGTTVTVYTSDGTLAATMPNVVGVKRQVANATIASSGFDVAKISYAWVPGDPAPGKPNSVCQVQSSNPEAGATAAKTDAITLTVYGKADGTNPGPGACPN